MGIKEGIRNFANVFHFPSVAKMEREQEEKGLRNIPRKFVTNTLLDHGECLLTGELKDLYTQKRLSRFGVHFDSIIDEGIEEGFLVTKKSMDGIEICLADFSAPQQVQSFSNVNVAS